MLNRRRWICLRSISIPYNSWINKRNQRTSGSGYADIVKGLEEVIDSFSVEAFLTLVAGNVYSLPLDYYLVNKILSLPSIIESFKRKAAHLHSLFI